MRVFVTGATGFVGSAVVKELIDGGHQVLGLARSESSAAKLVAAGAEVHRGDLDDADSLCKGAALADGVIHLGFNHDFLNFEKACETDRQVISTISEELKGSERPFIITAGILNLPQGNVATENTKAVSGLNPRTASEELVDIIAESGLHISVMRLSPSVHGEGDLHGFVPLLIDLARSKGVSAYVGEGLNRWPAVHRLDAARLFRLAIESNLSPGARIHAVAEEGIEFKKIAELIGKHLNIPTVSLSGDEAAAHFGWFIHFASADNPTSSLQTKNLLDWNPTHPVLIEDIDKNVYFK